MKVRAATPEDADTIARIHVDTWRAAYRGQIPEAYLDSLSVEERAKTWAGTLVRPGPGKVLVTDNLAGFCFFGPSRDGEDAVAEIFAIYVRPDSWRRGAGRLLCDEALRDARGRECSAMTLWVLTTNDRARRFYDHLGYAPDGGERTNTRLTGYPLHEMRYRRVL